MKKPKPSKFKTVKLHHVKYASLSSPVEIIPDVPPHNPVSRPVHYTQGKVECIDALEAATEGLEGAEAGLTWSVIKYMWRWKWKNGLEDLLKAQWYLHRLIDKVANDNHTASSKR